MVNWFVSIRFEPIYFFIFFLLFFLLFFHFKMKNIIQKNNQNYFRNYLYILITFRTFVIQLKQLTL